MGKFTIRFARFVDIEIETENKTDAEEEGNQLLGSDDISARFEKEAEEIWDVWKSVN